MSFFVPRDIVGGYAGWLIPVYSSETEVVDDIGDALKLPVEQIWELSVSLT
jgi:hypothetical protein